MIAIVSFVGFAGRFGLYIYRSRLLGIKPKTIPNSSSGSTNMFVMMAVFIGFNLGSLCWLCYWRVDISID